MDDVRRIKVFVASPSDVRSERELLAEVIADLNISQASRGVVLELVRWETHVHPDMGRTQGIVNDQIPPWDIDIFIGIMWSRFGTPTGDFGSGTVEEFQHAYERWKHERRPKILFYFRGGPYPVDTPDQVEQLGQVIAFRQTLEGSGLIGTYPNPEDFRGLVHLHLLSVLNELLRAEPPGPSMAPQRFTVFLASARSLLEPFREELLDELILNDIDILEPDKNQDAVAAQMARAHVCIHLVDGETHPQVEAQLELACEHAKWQILWLAMKLDPEQESAEPYRKKLLARYPEGRFDLIPGRDKIREIVERVERLKKDWLRKTSRGIFFNIHNHDMRLAKDLFLYLEEQKIEPLMNDEDKGAPTLKEFEEKASRSRAVVVFYGSVGAGWVRGRLVEAMKLMYSPGNPIEKVGVYVAPPSEPRKVPIRLKGDYYPMWMDNTSGFDPKTLEELSILF
jgi:hypothetical protein